MQTIDRLRWRRALVQAISIVFIIAFMALLFARVLRQYTYHTLEIRQIALVRDAASMSSLARAWDAGPSGLQALVDEWALLTGAQYAVLDQHGVIIADSASADETGADLSQAPDVAQVLQGHPGLSYGPHPATNDNEQYLYAAAPIVLAVAGGEGENGEAAGVLRRADSTAPVERFLRRLEQQIFLLSMVAALLIIGLMIMQIERTARSLRRLTDAAERITAGDLSARVLSLGRGDMGQLMQAFNRMAGKLESQIRKRKRETDRLNTVMHVMAGGVLILSRKGKVRMINPTAAELLNISEQKALKRSYVQAVRDHRIAAVWIRCRDSGHQEVSALDLGPDRFLRVIVTPFLSDNSRGYVVVIQDLTRLHKLQTVRQDFVSNVSHELRTPLASMRALVDTLRDGAMDDPPAARHFLDRMEIEVDSLTQMVQELLELSRIESDKVPLRISPTPVAAMIAGGVDRLRPQAERANIELVVTSPPDLPAVRADGERIQQVITNLVHNAIKFTPAGGRIEVTAYQRIPELWESNGAPLAESGRNTDDESGDDALLAPEMIAIAIADNGGGIASSDLPRIFERFYKTDPARTGGGTGLGLAIAKHIVQAHGGEIWAESVAGHGSTFFFTLPAAVTPPRGIRTG